MEKFINASSKEINSGAEVIDKEKVSDFIFRFNEKIRKGNANQIEYIISANLEKMPVLNKTELEYAKKLANEEGWKLSLNPESFTTGSGYGGSHIIYKMEKINS